MMNNIFNLIKVFLACTLIFSGLVKGVDPYGTSLKVLEYCNQFGVEVTTDISMVLSVILCGVEIYIGLCLAFNIYLKPMIYVALIILLLFTMIIGIMTIFPVMRIAECGCFGDLLPMSISMSFIKNIVLIIFAVILLFAVKLDFFHFSEKNNLEYVALSVILAFAIPLYSTIWLPFIEFSEYKIGADLNNIKSFQVLNGKYENITGSILNPEYKILIIKKREFTNKELSKIERLKTLHSKKQYSIDIITDITSAGKSDILYCSVNTLKMIVRTPSNAIVYLEDGVIIEKQKLRDIPI